MQLNQSPAAVGNRSPAMTEPTAIQGLMQDQPLLISSLIEHAASFHPNAEIVSRLPDGRVHRTHWRGIRDQACQVANALRGLGIGAGDRVGTLAWNSYRHLALYYGVSGSGAVLHTVNPRLFPEQIDYIVNHAEDQVLCFDLGFAALVHKLAPALKSVRHFIALCSRDELPASLDLPNLLCFDELVGAQGTAYRDGRRPARASGPAPGRPERARAAARRARDGVADAVPVPRRPPHRATSS